MSNLGFLFLGNGGAKAFLIFVKAIQASFNGLDSFLVER